MNHLMDISGILDCGTVEMALERYDYMKRKKENGFAWMMFRAGSVGCEYGEYER